MTKRILIVDDSSVLASLTNALFAGTLIGSPRIDVARSPPAALQMVMQRAYDLLLVNFQTESLDAMDVLRQLRDANHQTEAVVVAGWTTPRLIERGRTLGVERIYRLPAQIDDFTRHLRFV